MRTAVVVCPGRGTYGKAELGSLARFPDKGLLAAFDARRDTLGQETLTALDAASAYSVARHTRGDNASALIYACALGDFLSIGGTPGSPHPHPLPTRGRGGASNPTLRDMPAGVPPSPLVGEGWGGGATRPGIRVVAVTGNSMGWYTALACAGALSPTSGFDIANTMGALMHKQAPGGQMVHPCMGEDWVPDPARKAGLLATVAGIGARPGHALALSIDLGGMLVVAGDEAGLSAFAQAVPAVGRFPMRLQNHAAFHTALMAPISAEGRARLGADLFGQPRLPLIDGRGAIWWPGECEAEALHAYTLGHQVTEPYDFARAIRTAAREFAPDLFIVPGPGTTLGGAVAQSLILCDWRGMGSKADFQLLQSTDPLLVSMGLPDQRATVTGAI